MSYVPLRLQELEEALAAVSQVWLMAGFDPSGDLRSQIDRRISDEGERRSALVLMSAHRKLSDAYRRLKS